MRELKHTYAYIYTFIHSYIHTNAHTHVGIYIGLITYIQTHIRIYILLVHATYIHRHNKMRDTAQIRRPTFLNVLSLGTLSCLLSKSGLRILMWV